jgi:hypothetical protein
MSNKINLLLTISGVLAIMTFASMANVIPASADSSVLDNGASSFTPPNLMNSDEDETTNSANDLAPGIIQGRLPGGGCIAPHNAPGHLFLQDIPTT